MSEPWIFIDGVAMNEKHPDTFEIPERETLRNLAPGDSVKVGLVPGEGWGGERFWVTVTEVKSWFDRTVTIRGKVDNLLVFTGDHGLRYGDEIQFTTRNVLSVLRNSGSH